MQCYHCGATVRPGSRLCSNCGARLDTQPREPRFARGSKASWEDEPEESGNVDDRSSRRRTPNPLDDPRAPRVLREPPLSSLRRDSRRDGSRTDESWDAYQQSPGRGRSPARPEGRHPRGYDEAAGADSTEYSAEHPDFPTSRGRDRRDVIYDSRMPRSRAAGTPLERDTGRGSRRSQGPSSFAGDARRGQPHDVGARARGDESREEYLPRRPRTRAPGKSASASSSAPVSSRNRRFLAVFIPLVVILAIVASGYEVYRHPGILSQLPGGATSGDAAPPFIAYTPGPTPTAPSGFREFKSPHSQYVLDYPTGWSTSNTATAGNSSYDYVDQFTRSSPLASFTIEEDSDFSPLTRPQIIQAEVHGASAPGRTFKQIAEPIDTFEIGGEQWLRSDYMVVEAGGVSFQMAILACHHLQRGYAIVLLSLPNNFSQDTQTTFEPILDSLHFTG